MASASSKTSLDERLSQTVVTGSGMYAWLASPASVGSLSESRLRSRASLCSTASTRSAVATPSASCRRSLSSRRLFIVALINAPTARDTKPKGMPTAVESRVACCGVRDCSQVRSTVTSVLLRGGASKSSTARHSAPASPSCRDFVAAGSFQLETKLETT